MLHAMTGEPSASNARATARSPQPVAVVVDEVDPVIIRPGIVRRDLPSSGQVLIRAFDMEPGTRWPEVDVHDRDELIYVVSGELIEGEQRYPAGTYLHYTAGTSHQPRTDTGVRILVGGPATA